MSSRAHHPAERDSAEPSADGARAPGSNPGSGESYVTGVDDAVSREVRGPTLVEAADAADASNGSAAAGSETSADGDGSGPVDRKASPAGDDSLDDDDDAEEVVPEPDSVPPLVGELQEPSGSGAAEAVAVSGVAIAAIVDVGGPPRDGVEPPVVGERRSSRPPPLPSKDPPKDEASTPGERRSSRPPPLRDPSVEAPAATSADRTADELERAAGLETAREPFAGAPADRAAFQPPASK